MIRSNDPTPESIDRVLAVASVSINVTVNSTQCRMDASIMVVLGVFNAFVRNGDSLMSPARNAAPSWVIPTVRNRDAGTCAATPLDRTGAGHPSGAASGGQGRPPSPGPQAPGTFPGPRRLRPPADRGQREKDAARRRRARRHGPRKRTPPSPAAGPQGPHHPRGGAAGAATPPRPVGAAGQGAPLQGHRPYRPTFFGPLQPTAAVAPVKPAARDPDGVGASALTSAPWGRAHPLTEQVEKKNQDHAHARRDT